METFYICCWGGGGDGLVLAGTGKGVPICCGKNILKVEIFSRFYCRGRTGSLLRACGLAGLLAVGKIFKILLYYLKYIKSKWYFEEVLFPVRL